MPEQSAERIAEEVHRRATALTELKEITQKQSESIDRIVVALDHLTTAIGNRPTRGWVWKIAGFALGAILLLNGFMFGILISNQNYLKECTTPSTQDDRHGCYEDGQARTGQAISAIIRSNIYVAQCALEGRSNNLEGCVNEKLAAAAAAAGD